MAFFLWKDIKKDSHKKGVWLRVNQFYENKAFKKAMKLAGVNDLYEQLGWIVIDRVQKEHVVLRVVCNYPNRAKSSLRSRHIKLDMEFLPLERYLEVVLLALQNPKWICESDCGRGLVGSPTRTMNI
jgi:hypothetical protein